MRAIQRILCAVDLSGASADAAAQAIALATWCHARITALHVCEPVFAPIPGLPPLNERIREDERALARECLAQYFVGARAAGVPVEVRVDAGSPAAGILDCADATRADVIVMATHGASGVQHLVLGSVTEKVLRQARCGVLTVPPLARTAPPRPFSRILCPVDFSDPSLSAVESAVSLARASSATLTLMHVVEWPWHEPPPPADGLPGPQAAALVEFRRYIEASARMRLEKLAADVALESPPVLSIAHGRPYVEILRVAAESGADLIVMGVHGRNVVDMTLFGSTTNQLVRRATCPVLTFRQ
jgi:nucleotide-binding universal stress UspA family protein